jgi:hypothetical protein
MPDTDLPAGFWHSYPHPDRAPLPDRTTALAATVGHYPSWYVEVECPQCSPRDAVKFVSLLHLSKNWQVRPVRDLIAALVCRRCSSKPVRVELISRIPLVGTAVERIGLVG